MSTDVGVRVPPPAPLPPVARRTPVRPQEEPLDASRRTFLALGLAGLGSGLSACGAPPTTTPAAPSSTAVSPSPSAAPRPLVVGAPSRVLTRDPVRAWDSETFRVLRQVLEPLLGVDPDTGAPTLKLAEHALSEDALTHTLTLQRGLRFSDGTPCDAAAVVANVGRWSEAADGDPLPSAFVAAFGGGIADPDSAFAAVEADDDRTVRIRLSRPLRHLPAALGSPAFAVSSPASWAAADADGVSPAGTGPYRFADDAEAAAVVEALHMPGETTVLAPNPEHRRDLPDLPVAAVPAWGRASTRLRELRRGHADVIDVVAPGQLRPLVEAGTQVLPRDPFSVLYLGFNVDHPLMSSLYLRQAVAFAVDRPRLARSDVFLQGTAIADGLVPPALGVGVEDAPRYEINPERAGRLLEQAGYEGEPLELMHPAGVAWPCLPEPERVAAMVAEDLGVVGIHVRPVPVPPDQDYLRAVVERGSRALHLRGRDGLYRDAHAFLEPFARSGRAETRYLNPRVVEDVDAAASELDDERRRELHRRAHRALLLDLPALPLVHPISALATGPRVGSYPSSPQLDEPFDRIDLRI